MEQQTLSQAGDTIAYLNTLSAAGRSGEVLFQADEQNGKVYLHRGLIVWAFASGQDESFQSILIRENNFSREDLLEGIRRARKEGKRNLDEILAALGVEDAALRRAIVERHTKAALRVIRNWEKCVAQFNSGDSAGNETVEGLTLSSLLEDTLPPQLKKRAERRKPDAPSGVHRVPSPGARPLYKTDLAAPPAKDIAEVMERFRTEVPGFIAVVLIDGSTGMPISWLSDAEGLDAEAIGAFYRDIAGRTGEALQGVSRSAEGPASFEELLITSSRDYAILKSLKSGQHLLYLLTDRKANPGMARVVIRRYAPQLEAFLA